MVDWIVIGVLYVAVLLLFRFVGGVASAGEAMQRWGAREGRRWQRTHPRS